MRMQPFCGKRRTLAHAETLLLVAYNKPQSGKIHAA